MLAIFMMDSVAQRCSPFLERQCGIAGIPKDPLLAWLLRTNKDGKEKMQKGWKEAGSAEAESIAESELARLSVVVGVVLGEGVLLL